MWACASVSDRGPVGTILTVKTSVVDASARGTSRGFCVPVQILSRAATYMDSSSARVLAVAQSSCSREDVGGHHASEATRALTKCIQPTSEDGARLLRAAEVSALLSIAWMPSQDRPPCRLQPGSMAPAQVAPAPVTSRPALRLCSVKLLRSEAARLEKDHASAVAFGRNGVALAVHVVSDACFHTQLATATPAEMGADDESDCLRLRCGAEAAAALADMVAAAGDNKTTTQHMGGLRALLGLAGCG